MRAGVDLAGIVSTLASIYPEGAVVPLDAVGDAVGTQAVTPDDIEKIFAGLERIGRTVGAPEGGRGEASLKKVVGAARELRAEAAAGAKPTVAQIAERSGLTETDVRMSLALLRVMQR
jgi:hypothetical protein